MIRALVLGAVLVVIECAHPAAPPSSDASLEPIACATPHALRGGAEDAPTGAMGSE